MSPWAANLIPGWTTGDKVVFGMELELWMDLLGQAQSIKMLGSLLNAHQGMPTAEGPSMSKWTEDCGSVSPGAKWPRQQSQRLCRGLAMPTSPHQGWASSLPRAEAKNSPPVWYRCLGENRMLPGNKVINREPSLYGGGCTLSSKLGNRACSCIRRLNLQNTFICGFNIFPIKIPMRILLYLTNSF